MTNLKLKNIKKGANYKLAKVKRTLSLTLASISLFTVLTAPAQAATLDTPMAATTVYASSTYARVRVVDIVDKTIGSNITLPTVMEKFYTDGVNNYYLGSPKSHLIVVRYSNGTEKNIVEALNAGDITIKTLENYGIKVYSEKVPTIVSVVDNSKKPGVYVPQVLEKIYEDATNEYYLPTRKSSYIIVKYSNGIEKNIIQALQDGDITIKTLQNTYGIKINTVKKATIVSVVDNSKKPGTYLEQALEKIYEDDKNEYYFNVVKSSLVIVKYSNGTQKTIVEALNDGDLTISQLQSKYGISVITKARTNRIASVVDRSKDPGVYVPQVKELIYCDGEYNYYFSSQKSKLVIVNYIDGTQKDIVQALKDKDLTIGDLQFTYNISLTIEKVNADKTYYNPNGLYKAPDGSYWTSQKEYEDWAKTQTAPGKQYSITK